MLLQSNESRETFNSLKVLSQEDLRQRGIIRYKAENSDIAFIPRSPDNVVDGVPGTITGGWPYTGQGHTAGNHDRLGVPEWIMGEADLLEAEIYQVSANGTETLVAVYDFIQAKFIYK